jgi:acyl-CoA thioester hydrolase
MQVVHHTSYLVWFEVARTELLRSLGIPYTEIQKRGFYIPVVEAFASYSAPARYDDEVEVRIWPTKIGRTSIRLDYEVTMLPGKQVLCTGHTVHVFVGRDSRPKEIPRDIREKLT